MIKIMYLSLGEKKISKPMYTLSKGSMGHPLGTWAPERAFLFSIVAWQGKGQTWGKETLT